MLDSAVDVVLARGFAVVYLDRERSTRNGIRGSVTEEAGKLGFSYMSEKKKWNRNVPLKRSL